jgi:hypothetical protein
MNPSGRRAAPTRSTEHRAPRSVRRATRARRARATGGFVAIEFMLAVGLLLFPVVLLVGTLPQWSERQHAAIVAATEASRAAAQAWPADGDAAGERAARDVMSNYGIAPADVSVVVSPPPGRGQMLTVAVTIRMPAIAIPLLAHAGSWSWTAHESVRIDDYRSR